jgi:hypothetical protein
MPIHGKSIQYEKPPMGLNPAVIAGVYDIGTHVFEWKGETSENPQVILALELAAKQSEGEYAGKPFRIYKFASLYMSKNAKLRKDVQAILGRTLSDSEAAAFDLENLLGTNCYVSLVADGEKYKIDSFIANPNPNPKIVPEDTKEPEFVTKKRAESLEAKGQTGKPAPQQNAPHGPDEGDSLPF